MKNLTIIGLLAFIFMFGACRKNSGRISGVCYCSYYSGDKKEFDLRHLPRSEQIDSCYQYDINAEPFAGDCELE